MKNKDENAKDPRWITPMEMPGVRPEEYDAAIDSGSGSARKEPGAKPAVGQVVIPPDDEDDARKQQKKRRQLPLHDEPIGGA